MWRFAKCLREIFVSIWSEYFSEAVGRTLNVADLSWDEIFEALEKERKSPFRYRSFLRFASWRLFSEKAEPPVITCDHIPFSTFTANCFNVLYMCAPEKRHRIPSFGGRRSTWWSATSFFIVPCLNTMGVWPVCVRRQISPYFYCINQILWYNFS